MYRDIPEHIMDFIGENRRTKLTFVAGALKDDSLPPEGLPEVRVLHMRLYTRTRAHTHICIHVYTSGIYV